MDAILQKGTDFFSNSKDNVLDALSGGAKGFFLIPSFLSGKDNTEVDLEVKQAEAQKAILEKAKSKLFDNPMSTSSKTALSADDYKSGKFFTYEVQYNPASISLTSKSGTHRQKKAGIQGLTGYEDYDIPVFTELSMTLIYEAINTSDAFLFASESFSLGIGDVVSMGSDIANKVATAVSGAESPYSVRKNVQGFLALMTRTGWRDVTFFYGQNCFHGQLTSVTPKYKMFNKSGEPIYAEVEIVMRQDTHSAIDNKIWEASFLKTVNYEKKKAGLT